MCSMRKIKFIIRYKKELKKFSESLDYRMEHAITPKIEIRKIRREYILLYKQLENINKLLYELYTESKNKKYSMLTDCFIGTLLSSLSAIEYYEKKVNNPNKWVISFGKAGPGRAVHSNDIC